MIRRPGCELAREARDWLRRRLRSGALLELPTDRPSADRARRPDGCARYLLDRPEGPERGAEDRGRLVAEAEALRRRVESQPRPRRAARRAGPAGPPSAAVRSSAEIGQALHAIAHPELGVGPPFTPSPRARRSPARGDAWLAGPRAVLLPAASLLSFAPVRFSRASDRLRFGAAVLQSAAILLAASDILAAVVRRPGKPGAAALADPSPDGPGSKGTR